jgi:tRNA pseudouridine13 synthase
MRDLAADEAQRIATRAAAAADDGFPDYYDDQRFGSLRGAQGRFVARALLAGDAEGALKLAIASPAREDRSRTKRRRRLLRERWGDFPALARQLDPSVERRICERLAAGASFGQAYALLDRALRSLHLSAYQAHLFNECLRRAIGRGAASHPGLCGPYVFYEGDPGSLRDRAFPLASGEAPEDPLLDAVLADEGIDRGQLARAGFRKGTRRAVAFPEDLSASAPEPDGLNAGRVRLTLAFRLRPGSYATMLVKRCTYDL